MGEGRGEEQDWPLGKLANGLWGFLIRFSLRLHTFEFSKMTILQTLSPLFSSCEEELILRCPGGPSSGL